MKFDSYLETDVLVMGAGLAGCIAAISAAEAGATVCIVSSANIFSGSSFYPGTWGLGLIGPENSRDEADLIETIMQVGEQMADRKLVHTFVSHITEGIEYLERMGLRLKKAEKKGEREFIPCFDHKNRNWNGLIQEDTRTVFSEKMNALAIRQLSHTSIIKCVMDGDQVKGAVAVSREHGCIFLSCKSMILASGGLGGLFKYRLNTSDITGMGQYLGLMAGASLVNLEFMQMMPGYLRPAPKTIFNEKVFRYSRFCSLDTEDSIWPDWSKEKEKLLLEQRSTHGPYTSRLASAAVDERIFECFLRNSQGVKVSYKKEIWENQPEFVRTYFDWLEEQKHLTVQDSFQMGIYAHASNGGIKIDEAAYTGVSGLFACGEVTGGMHGADRLGGLSTANGLVFGRIAGASAAKFAKSEADFQREAEISLRWIPNATVYLEKIRQINFDCAMIFRDGTKIKDAQGLLSEIEIEVCQNAVEVKLQERGNQERLVKSYELEAALALSKCLLEAISLRKESRGSHHRNDYPHRDIRMEKMIICSFKEDVVIKFV